ATPNKQNPATQQHLAPKPQHPTQPPPHPQQHPPTPHQKIRPRAAGAIGGAHNPKKTHHTQHHNKPNTQHHTQTQKNKNTTKKKKPKYIFL
ncbi:hypothetical protein RA262_27875, partial [Pseudomonas syringae pv. tagetis]